MLPYLLTLYVITHSWPLNENRKIMPFHLRSVSESGTVPVDSEAPDPVPDS